MLHNTKHEEAHLVADELSRIKLLPGQVSNVERTHEAFLIPCAQCNADKVVIDRILSAAKSPAGM